MKRYLESQVIQDLEKKMVFLGGPRQVGKTTLAQGLCPKSAYLNWDDNADREKILTQQLPPTKIWVFDEIHKYKKWRNYLKGLYDKNKSVKKILVTGSARLDFYRYSGDSLQGRYHFLRLHPLSMDELGTYDKKTFNDLFELGGFPEPFLSGKKIDALRWSREYRSRILKDDIRSIETIEDLGSAENALIRLPALVSSPLSINALREDIQVDFGTLKRWLDIFERFYAIFRISPFGSPKIKAIKKEQKHYHYDWTLVKDPGARFENMVASHLLKWVHFIEDTQGRDMDLRFYKDQEKREVDFVVTEDGQPKVFIECKLSKNEISSHLKYINKKFPKVAAYQMTMNSDEHYQNEQGIQCAPAFKVLKEIRELVFK